MDGRRVNHREDIVYGARQSWTYIPHLGLLAIVVEAEVEIQLAM